MTPRERLETLIEDAISMLDRMDGDCDLEQNGDMEPYIAGSNTDREADFSDYEIGEPDEFYPEGSWLRGGGSNAA